VSSETILLGEFEQMVLLAVLQAGDRAYGIAVHGELKRRARRRVALGAVYMTLDRLEKKGLLSSTMSEPVAERGGRARRCYTVTRPALAALRTSREALMSLWSGLRLAEK
jgi:PadR family transcriptional regulator, regulatory protein PadR